MSEYYGAPTTPTDSFLAHYGIKGMKWGVRRAKLSGNAKKLDRAYRKAAKRLQKLNDKASISVQNNKMNEYNKLANKYKKIGLAGASIAAGSVGGNLLAQKLRSGIYKKYEDAINNAAMDYANREAFRLSPDTKKMTWEQVAKDPRYSTDTGSLNTFNRDIENAKSSLDNRLVRNDLAQKITEGLVYGGAGLAGIGTGAYAANKIRAVKARKRTTVEGHKKAVAERNEWKREMDKAFAGTKYASKKHKKKRRSHNG